MQRMIAEAELLLRNLQISQAKIDFLEVRMTLIESFLRSSSAMPALQLVNSLSLLEILLLHLCQQLGQMQSCRLLWRP
jgi:hypothetical protein